MTKLFLTLILLSSTLLAKPYYSEYRGNGRIIIFHGNIKEENEPKVKVLQTQYLESLYVRSDKAFYELELNDLGITVVEVPDNPYVPSENTYPQ